MSFNYVAIVSIKGNDYRIHFWYMSKDEAISMMHNSSLNEKTGILYIFFLTIYKKMAETAYYQKNRDIILNRA